MTAGSARRGALDGLIVLDLTAMLAGPYCTMMLADQGARVIKIEPPGGDKTRRNGPHLVGAIRPEDGGFGGYFGSTNRNKESLVIDLKKPEGHALFLRLVKRADVVIENYRSGVMERLSLSYERLREVNPRLVYGALRGFGDRRSGASKYLEWPAYDPVSQAMGGIMGITGQTRNGAPTKIGPGIGDIGPAMFLAFGIASACWRAQRTGSGQFVDVAMTDSVLAICERIVFQYGATRKSPGPEGNGHPLLCPFGLFQAKDGFISLGVPNDHFWALTVERMGSPEWACQDRFATNDSRVANSDELEAHLTAWTIKRTKRELSEIFGGHIPLGPVFDAADIFEDEHFRIRNMLVETEQPGTTEKLTIAGTPIHMSDTPGGVRKRAPLVGEHTTSVLIDLGLTEQEISALREHRVVQQRTTD
ncbi:Succinyl-CoA:mesaconate CoA-transferase [Paraburkholderia unamae]|uniref:CaiB/BaiF CoA transferase family protein n=1 Tax=Paraburkholderia unamae TaxID=219649 RepID=UPI001CAF6DFE|nr:CoA transferase [Paraburkholderia unamae]CAG9245972.1 Succinyl-CoA:mesaconate CoA-transferase [Paraburkholderia unamae]